MEFQVYLRRLEMPKYKVVVSMGVYSAIVEADNEEQAKEKAGDEVVKNLEQLGDSIFEIYEATPEDIEAYEKEKATISL